MPVLIARALTPLPVFFTLHNVESVTRSKNDVSIDIIDNYGKGGVFL